MSRKGGLGRGLDSLIPGGEPQTQGDTTLFVPIQKIQSVEDRSGLFRPVGGLCDASNCILRCLGDVPSGKQDRKSRIVDDLFPASAR